MAVPPTDVVRTAYDHAARTPEFYPHGFDLHVTLKSGEVLAGGVPQRPVGDVLQLGDGAAARFVSIDNVAVAVALASPDPSFTSPAFSCALVHAAPACFAHLGVGTLFVPEISGIDERL